MMEFKLYQPGRLMWTSVLCSLLISGVVTNYDDKEDMDNHCALRLGRLQTPYTAEPHIKIYNKRPIDVQIGSYYNEPKSYDTKFDDEYTEHYVNHPLPKEAIKTVCIRYKDVNEALAEAKEKLRFEPVAVNSLEDIYRVANLIIETTRILAQKFELTFEEIGEYLPTIDTSKTDIWDICPAKFKPMHCSKTRFRNIDGHCSDFKNSLWGSAGAPLERILPPDYKNGIDSPRVSSVEGGPLPHVREVSIAVHPDISDLSDRISILLMSWGQFIDHDLTLGAMATNVNGASPQCCPNKTHPNCMPIHISKDDPFYSRYGSTCMEFLRTSAGLRLGCALGFRMQTNLVSTRMDANFVYGNTDSEARGLRLGSKGLMKSWPKFRDLGLKDLPPPMTETPDLRCIRTGTKYCFLTGDERANIQPHVIALHTLYLRDHNRIATELGYLNPHWDDERIYQETRHILAATVQHIAYNEYLPILLGPTYMKIFNLTLQREGYWYGYDKNTPLITLLPFQTAAFRFGHSLIHGKVRLYNKYHEFLDSWELRNVLNQPFNMYQPGIIDKVIAGFLNTPIQSFDRFLTSEVTKHLFQRPEKDFGRDLASLNINRGREHGLVGYNDYREWCGMPRAKSFKDLEYYLNNGTALKLSNVYKHPDDIDLWTGGLSERAVPGGVVGPTFACIIGHQFHIVRKADRFWYENPGFPSSFTPAQLQELRKVTQAKVICENADDIPTTQTWVLFLPHPKLNPRVLCEDLPQINLQYWIEDPNTGSFKYPK